MIGALVGAGVSAVGSIVGGISAARARRKAKQRMERQAQENKSWYDQRMNEDVTQRADAQRMLTTVEESIKNRNKAAAGTQAVMGGTDESLAATKQANNEALAETTSAIAASGDARKDNIESQYRQTKANIAGQKNAYDLQSANNISQAIGGVANAAGNVIGAFADGGAKAATGATDAGSGTKETTGATDASGGTPDPQAMKNLSLAQKLAMTGHSGNLVY